MQNLEINNEASQKMKVVGISEMLLSSHKDDIIVTYALGSCLGVCVYDPAIKMGGILHCLLPLSSHNPEKARQNPFMYVDTGITAFLDEFFMKGGMRSRMILKVAGCGNMMDANQSFNIGQRNFSVLRKLLWKNNILIKAELIGGDGAKTMKLFIETGSVSIKTPTGEMQI